MKRTTFNINGFTFSIAEECDGLSILVEKGDTKLGEVFLDVHAVNQNKTKVCVYSGDSDEPEIIQLNTHQ